MIALLVYIAHHRPDRMAHHPARAHAIPGARVGLGIDDPTWHPTAFTTNRERLLEGEVAGRFVAAVLDRRR